MSVEVEKKGSRRPVSEEDKQVFLAALEEGWSMTRAALMANHTKATFDYHREKDEEFAAAARAAVEAGTDKHRDNVADASFNGWDEVTTDGDGKVLRVVRRRDPRLSLIELKRRDPEYRDNAQVAVHGPTVNVLQIEDRSAPLEEVARILREAGSRAVGGEPVDAVVAGTGRVRAELGPAPGVGPADGVPVPSGD